MSVENLLIVDTETTGLNPAEGQVIEVGAILYNVPNRTTVTQLSFLLPSDNGNPQYDVNGIPESVLGSDFLTPKSELFSVSLLKQLISESDYAIAHSAMFDSQWFNGFPLPEMTIPWLCTYHDFRFPKKSKCALSELVWAHGGSVSMPHRALNDCLLIAWLFNQMSDLNYLIQYASLPGQFYVFNPQNKQQKEQLEDEAKRLGFKWDKESDALISKIKDCAIDQYKSLPLITLDQHLSKKVYIADVPYSQKDKAKDALFSWDKLVPGKWAKRLTDDEARSLPFPVYAA